MTYLVNINYMHNIVYSRDSIRDLNEIASFISLDNPFQAKLVLENIYSSIDYLSLFPFLWKERKDELREILSKNKYRIFYRIENNKVIIISIFKYKDF